MLAIARATPAVGNRRIANSPPTAHRRGQKALAIGRGLREDRNMSEPDCDQVEGHLSQRECWERLRTEAYGRLAIVDDDGPAIYPINAIVDHATVVFRTTEGAKLDAIRADGRVAFEVDGWDPDSQTAWSVAIRGTASEIVRMHDAVTATQLGVTPWQAGPKPTYVRITPTSVSGREFVRSDPDADADEP